jgi:hypothetical protein
MLADTLAFLHALYDGVPEGYLTLTAIHPDKHHPTPSRHVRLHDGPALIEALKHLLEANAQGWGAYFGVAPRQTNLGRWRRGGKDDLVCLPAVFVDIDDEPAAALARLRRFSPPPSAIVRSGGGIHGWWWVTPTADFALAERVLRGLAHTLGGDHTTVANALRLPGSVNTKAVRNGALCHLVELHPERRYSLPDFAQYAPDPPLRQSHVCHESPHLDTPHSEHVLNPALIEAVTDCLMNDFGGRVKSNGWIAALCPCGHGRDFPGSHFNFDTTRSVGRCFGRHGRLLLKDLCAALKLQPADYGGIYASR